MKDEEEAGGFLHESPKEFAYSVFGFFGAMLLTFGLYDWCVRIRNRKVRMFLILVSSADKSLLSLFLFSHKSKRVGVSQLVLSAAKSSEVVSSLFPDRVRSKVLEQTKTNRRTAKDKQIEQHAVVAELYPQTTVRK